jgi:hypothetical protein
VGQGKFAARAGQAGQGEGDGRAELITYSLSLLLADLIRSSDQSWGAFWELSYCMHGWVQWLHAVRSGRG